MGQPDDSIARSARDVLHFWFEEVSPEQRFMRDDGVDAECTRRFGALRDAVLASDAEGWRGDPETTLAAIILLDQFSRNIYRGEAEAFAADPLALELTLSAIAARYPVALPSDRRAFLYMPLMHSEDRGVQRFSIRCFAEPGLDQNHDFAVEHRAVIERFGRFPGRNVALGRETTPEEAAFLAEGKGNW